MPSHTVENYLKAILKIGIRDGSDWISTGKLAQEVSLSPGTVTSMQKTLAEAGLATYRPYEGVCLTDHGRLLALRMLRRHRLIEQFLVETLDLTWDRVHEEAENMEHAVSDFLIDRIDEFLGKPQFDPHGDPIPESDGDMRGDTDSAIQLAECSPTASVRVVRVTNQDPAFLRYLSESGIDLGIQAQVKENNREAGVISIDIGENAVAMGHPAAEQVLVELV